MQEEPLAALVPAGGGVKDLCTFVHDWAAAAFPAIVHEPPLTHSTGHIIHVVVRLQDPFPFVPDFLQDQKRDLREIHSDPIPIAYLDDPLSEIGILMLVVNEPF